MVPTGRLVINIKDLWNALLRRLLRAGTLWGWAGTMCAVSPAASVRLCIHISFRAPLKPEPANLPFTIWKSDSAFYGHWPGSDRLHSSQLPAIIARSVKFTTQSKLTSPGMNSRQYAPLVDLLA